MRLMLLSCLVPAAMLLTACHSQGGYLSADPELTYGPGVVEFPDPSRVYLHEYRRIAAGGGSPAVYAVAAAPVAVQRVVLAPTVAPPARMDRITRPTSTRRIVRPVRSAPVRATHVSTRVVEAPRQVTQVRQAQPVRQVSEVRRVSQVNTGTWTPAPATIRSQTTVVPTVAPAAPMPAHIIPRAGANASTPPFPGAPLPAPTRSRGFTELEIVR